jgi:hypothetical protein
MKSTAADFDKVVEIAKTTRSPIQGWQAVISYANERAARIKDRLATLNIEDAVSDVRKQLLDKWKVEPVPHEVDFLYFGLFDLGFEGDSSVYAGFYVSGGSCFDSHDSNSLCDLPYFPDNRIIRSEFLDGIKRAGEMDVRSREFVDYAVAFGAAALLSKFSIPEIGRKLRIVVGFDSGDFAEIT